MRRFSLVLFLFVLLTIASACGSSIPKSSVSLERLCIVGNGVFLNCEVTLFNDPKATGTFNWKASATPTGVIIVPSSGSLPPGGHSSIHITFRGLCPVNLSFTGADGTVVKDNEACP